MRTLYLPLTDIERRELMDTLHERIRSLEDECEHSPQVAELVEVLRDISFGLDRLCELEYCDECGSGVLPNQRCAVESLPVDLWSASKGESATLCGPCFARVVAASAGEGRSNG